MDTLPTNRLYPMLLGLSGLLALALGFLLFPPSQALVLIRQGGYWFMAVTVSLFAISLFRYLRAQWKTGGDNQVDWVRLGISLAATGLLLVHEPFGFKVLMDELVLAATAMSMHLFREVFVPLQTHNFDGAYIVVGGIVDKRPYFFPFLLSILHDLTGYRPENVFWLNGVLVFALFGLVGHYVGLVVNRSAGRLSVVLLAGLPLLALNATGGGFEILNLVMIVLAMVAATSYLTNRDAVSLNLLVLSGVLLAQTRYESVLFVVPISIIVLVGWLKAKQIRLTWIAILSPLLLIPYPLQNSVFNAFKGFWQLPEEVGSPFSLEFLGDNLSHAVAYFFEVSPLQSNSVLLGFAGVIGLILLIVLVIRMAVGRDQFPPSMLVLLAFGAVVVVTFSILMCYHWGQLDSYVVSRLSLPFWLLFAMAVPVVLADFKPSPRIWNGALILAAAYAAGFGIPSAARAYSTETFFPYRSTEWFREFVREHSDEGAYFIVPSPLIAVVYRQSAITNSFANGRAPEIDYHLEHGTYSGAYVFQVLKEDLVNGTTQPDDNSFLNEDEFILEMIAERKFAPNFRSRISRVVSIEPGSEEDRMEDELRLIRLEVNEKTTGMDLVDEEKKKFLDMLP